MISKFIYMKRLSILLILSITILNGVYSQEKNTSKEVGLYFSNLDAFGFRYKFGNEKRMFRITALALSIGNLKYTESTDFNLNVKDAGAALNLGLEFPVKIKDNFSLYYGGELRGSYNHNYYTRNNMSSYDVNYFSAGIGFILGFSYHLKSNIVLSAEIVPALNYNQNVNSGVSNETVGFGLDSNAAGITLSYRFNKK